MVTFLGSCWAAIASIFPGSDINASSVTTSPKNFNFYENMIFFLIQRQNIICVNFCHLDGPLFCRPSFSAHPAPQLFLHIFRRKISNAERSIPSYALLLLVAGITSNDTQHLFTHDPHTSNYTENSIYSKTLKHIRREIQASHNFISNYRRAY